VRMCCLLCFALAPPVVQAQGVAASESRGALPQAAEANAEQLFVLANQTRVAQGLSALKWDPALAAAALQHCNRMAAEGPISHRYRGEPDLTTRAGAAGAHFSLIEENIAVGSSPARIHAAWMESPDHRDNLLNPTIDRVGIGVVSANNVQFAVADYGRGVEVLNPAQVEAHFAGMLRDKGLAIKKDPSEARAYCASSGRFTATDSPGFLMRWQNPDLTQLPADLVQKAASGDYRQAAVGSCPAQDVNGDFTIYRVAVILYGAEAATRPKSYF
jgi:hypothetical protein